MPKPALIGRRSPIEDYIDVVRDHKAFRNSNRSFCGAPCSPLESLRLFQAVRRRSITGEGNDGGLALSILLDEPDYVIYSNDRPIAWHSTTRGIDSKALPPNPERWEWVIPPNRNRYYRTHYRIASEIVDYLNGEMNNV